ncbi:hypothetical protein QFC21_002740 [Naganishia friedmannii]|uniref:Uncharacterized protein n=1 Tax=Naganishia friedmannii TaxID=89922 RepID=A0ACC2VSF0_9TREE|nr:hypothetical protein QFC21_002740 [Naganishia friedmannii]
MTSRKRVSYSLATPCAPLPELGFPPPIHDQIGRFAPSYRTFPARQQPPNQESKQQGHPTHCLGVTALALDKTTILSGQQAPQGILYTGGRDGLVASWEQGVPMKRTEGGQSGETTTTTTTTTTTSSEPVKWERIGVDDEEEEEDEEYGSASAFDAVSRGRAVGRAGSDPAAAAMQGREEGAAAWQVDRNAVQQGFVGPHSQEAHDQPALVGVHNDYVKCLAFAPQPSLLFSGGLDAQINVWDIHSPKPYEPVVSIAAAAGGEQDTGIVGGGADKGSVYALVTNSQGTLLASGTPERIIRLWDPRVGVTATGGKSSAGGLVGHTDNVKALLMSEDGRYMLSGSSDSTVKLWSLAAQRCIHTFTHHTHPIWSLASSHPNLERFFSGDRAGHLCVTDLAGISSDWGQGECTLLAKCERRRGEREGTQGIVRIETMCDEFVWTATASADVVRWRDVGSRSTSEKTSLPPVSNGYSMRAEPPVAGRGNMTPTTSILGSQNPFLSVDTRDGKVVAFVTSPPGATEAENTNDVALAPAGIAYASMISLGAPADCTGPYPTLARGSLSHGPSLYTASAVSLPRDSEAKSFQGHARVPSQASLFPFPRNGAAPRDPAEVARIQFENRDLASEATPLRTEPDAVIRGRPGLIRAKVLNDRQHVLALDTAGKVSIWNIIKGLCLGTFKDEEVEGVFKTNDGLVHGADGELDSKEALDLIAEYVDGQSSVRQWCEVDTRIGSITVHMEEASCWDGEVYADQVGYANDPDFRQDDKSLIKVEAAAAAKHEQSKPPGDASALPGANAGPTLQRGSAPTYIALDRAAGSGNEQRIRSQSSASGNEPMTPGGLMVGLATPAATPAIVPAGSGSDSEGTGPNLDSWANRGRTNGHLAVNTLSTIPQSPALGSPTPALLSPSAVKSPRGDSSNGKDYFSFSSKKSRGTTPGPVVTKDTSPTRRPDSAALVTPGGSQPSFMGKFKGFGGKNKKASDTLATPNGSNVVSSTTDDANASQLAKPDDKDTEQLHGLDEIRSQPFHPPYYSDAPPFDFPENTAVIISETSQSAGAWAVIYRSMVSKVERNPQALELAAPTWLLDYLFTGRTKTVEAKKLTFLLEPWPDAEEEDRLPPLPPTIISYVRPQIDMSSASRRESVASTGSGLIRPAAAPARVEGADGDGMIPTPLGAKSPGKFMAVEQAAIAAAAAERTKGQDSTQQTGDALRSLDTLEILCNGVVVPLNMTLAAVKQFIWNNPGVHGPRGPGLYLPSAADVVLNYRLKKNGL